MSPVKLIVPLLVFLAVVKIYPVFDSDIQPWDEAMYAARVNSILVNGDFFDQSAHSVGKFYSGSHPPLLIWIGYFTSLAFGFNPVSLKLLMIFLSICTVAVVYIYGSSLDDSMTGIFAAMIFAGNILFNVFSKRFQLDIPYLLFMLLSFWFALNAVGKKRMAMMLLSGIFFGLCLMSKILVGLFIPFVLMLCIVFMKDKSPVSFKDLAVIMTVGAALALPWHVYMYAVHGSDFAGYFFGFHLIERAIEGVEMNQKSSGILYYPNYFLSIIPFGILLFFAFLHDMKTFSNLNSMKMFLWIWTISGFVIISLFMTKLESYLLLVLPPSALLIASYIKEAEKESPILRKIIMTAILLNIAWFFTEEIRPILKQFAAGRNIYLAIGIVVAVIALLAFGGSLIARITNLQTALSALVIFSFVAANIYYLINRPQWEDRFRIREIMSSLDKYNVEKIVYIGSGFRYNPQFSYYFNGIDLGWNDPKYGYEFMDTDIGEEKVLARLKMKNDREAVLVERDKINRSEYPDPALFIPDDYILEEKDSGYELYMKRK